MDHHDVLVLILVCYFVPAIVATLRKHRNRMAITVLNVFAGWTFIGWIAALVWACTKDVECGAALEVTK